MLSLPKLRLTRLAPVLLLLCLALDLGSAVIALGHDAALWN